MTAVRHPLHPSDIVRIRGERWCVLRHVPYAAAAVLEVEGAETGNRGIHSRFVLPFETVDRLLPAAMQPRVVSLAAWRHVARRALADSSPHWSSLRAAAPGNFTLLPFQLEPAMALTRGEGCRFLIADEVGLGKTVQAGLMIAELLAREPDARALVVAPAGLREQWRTELQVRFSLEAQICDAVTMARAVTRFPADVNPWFIHRLIVTSIDYVKRPDVMRSLEALIWDIVVFDEAHALSGHSDRASAAAALAGRARHVVMLTATPHSGDDDGFRRLCGVGEINGRYPLLMFRRTRGDIGITGRRRSTLLRVQPSRAEVSMHRALFAYARLVWRQSREVGVNAARLAMIVLARRACSSASSLARSVERRLALLGVAQGSNASQLALPLLGDTGTDEAPDGDLAAPGLPDERDERQHLEHLLALAREAAVSESKLRALRRFIDRVREPLIVFTEYRDTLEHVAAALAGVEYVGSGFSRTVPIEQLHGGLTRLERSRVLGRFAAGDTQVLLATDTASEGLNLHQRCRLVVSLEIPWTPVRLEQRTGRVDRLGQMRPVHALHFVAAGTSEQSVLARLVERARRAEASLRTARDRRPLDEHQVAACVLDDQPLPDRGSSPPIPAPPGVVQPDLRCDAEAEVVRIAAARRLSAPTRGPAFPSRGVVVSRRRRRSGGMEAYWVFRLCFVDPEGRTVWQSLSALHATGGERQRRSADIRATFDPRQTSISRVLSQAHAQSLDALRLALKGPVDLMAARERDIMMTLQHRHARMAADLLQRGLFDRRVERLAAAQSQLVEHALLLTTERLHVLNGLTQAAAGGHELVFAIAIH